MTTRILLIRHADTQATQEDRFSGGADVPLCEEGKNHARELAVRLSQFPIDALYSSPWARALETAKSIAASRGLPVSLVEGFREIDHGHWTGLTHAEVQEKYPEEYARFEHDPLKTAPEGGESAQQVLDRALLPFEQILTACVGQVIAIVAHKTTNRLLIASHVGVDLRSYRQRLGQRPACINVLDFEQDDCRLTLLNDISHYRIDSPPDTPYGV